MRPITASDPQDPSAGLKWSCKGIPIRRGLAASCLESRPTSLESSTQARCELSNATETYRVKKYSGSRKLGFNIYARNSGTYALWLRARWEPQSSTHMTLTLDEDKTRDLRAAAMIGFTDWTDPKRAHTKMFAHYGEQYGHWS